MDAGEGEEGRWRRQSLYALCLMHMGVASKSSTTPSIHDRCRKEEGRGMPPAAYEARTPEEELPADAPDSTPRAALAAARMELIQEAVRCIGTAGATRAARCCCCCC